MAIESIEKEAHGRQRNWFEVKTGKFDGECIPTGSHSARVDADMDRPEETHLTQAVKNGNEYQLVYETHRGTKVYATSREECQNVINANVESASPAPKSYRVFAVLDQGGNHFELSDEPVETCVRFKGEYRSDWKLAWIVGRWTGTVKSCWRKQHYEKQRVESNFQSDSEPTVYVTVPAHDEIIVCFPYVRQKNAREDYGPACKHIVPAYFTAVDSLPRAAF